MAPTVVQYGGVPPPVGGVTVHIANLTDRLNDALVRTYVVDRTRSRVHEAGPQVFGGWTAPLHALRRRGAVHHVHVSSPNAARLLVLWLHSTLLPQRRLCLTFHSGTFPDAYRTPLRARLIRLLGRRVDTWFALNHDSAVYLEEELRVRANVVLTTSYVRQLATQSPREGSPIATPMFPGRRIVATSGYGVRNSGFLELARIVRAMGDQWAVVVAAYGDWDTDYMREVESEVRSHGGVLLRDQSREQFADILSKADVYVRHTRFDAFGLAVAEALEVGTPALATNVCRRADGCTPYARNDEEALRTLIADVAGKDPGDSAMDSFPTYEQTYRRMLTKT